MTRGAGSSALASGFLGLLLEALESAGFVDVRLCRDCPQGDAGRLFIVATRNEE